MRKKICPRISIVTPSYNQAQFLEDTIQSVLDQNYPNLEYIIIDGGSTDNSIEILRKYDSHLYYWVSEADRGQTHAINKGLYRSTGEIWAYLNSDDLLCAGALTSIAEVFDDTGISWVGGISSIFEGTHLLGDIVPNIPMNLKEYLTPWNRQYQYVFPCSNVSFMRRSVLECCGLFDETYQYSMDIEYYIRAIFKGKFIPYLVSDVLGKWRWHSESKTVKKGNAYGFRDEEVRIAEVYLKYLEPQAQQELKNELVVQKRWLIIRHAIFEAQHGERRNSFSRLLKGTKSHPSLFWFRPWYGALRRVMFDTLMR